MYQTLYIVDAIIVDRATEKRGSRDLYLHDGDVG